MKRAFLMLLALGPACDPWDDLPSNSTTGESQAMWSPEVIPLADGLYAMLPAAKAVARIQPSGAERLDLEGSLPSRMVASTDGESLLVFGSYPSCDTEESGVETIEDCDKVEGEVVTNHEINLVRDGALVAHVPIDSFLTGVAFSHSGDLAVAYADFSAGIPTLEGLGNPTEALFINMSDGAATPVALGFVPERVLFDDSDSVAVMLSRSRVVVLDIRSGSFDPLVSFPLSLDVDDRVQPTDVALTPDGRYALITIAGAGDLYVLDLERESINIVSLPAAPADMVVDTQNDRTLLVYSGVARADILEHEYFETTTVTLEEPTSQITMGSSFALLYYASTANTQFHDLYRLNPLNQELVEYRLENPASSVVLSPDELYAVAITHPEGGFTSDLEGYYDANWGVEILDMGSDDSIALVAAAQPVGLAFAEGQATALALLQGQADLLRIDLSSGDATAVELNDAPLGIGATADGGFYITHDAALGLVSFLDPADDSITAVGGFGAFGLFGEQETPLPVRAE